MFFSANEFLLQVRPLIKTVFQGTGMAEQILASLNESGEPDGAAIANIAILQQTDLLGGQPLHHFAKTDADIQVVRKALFPGADVDAQIFQGFRVVYATCDAGASECLMILVDAKANLNLPAATGATPAHIASEKGNSEGLKLLIIARASFKQANIDGGTLACMSSQKAILNA